MSGPARARPVGLVLEGGAMRGLYTAGVLDVLMENRLWADLVIGVSAGALHGASYVSNQPGRTIRYYEKYRADRHFMGLYSLLTTGDVVGRQFCYYDIPQRLDVFDEAAFEASRIRFYAVCTDVETGRAAYFRLTELATEHSMELLRAGASMPLVSRIVEVDGRKYLDGGVADSIPLARAQALGCSKNIVVLTQPAGYLKPPARKAPFAAAYRRYPAFVQAMADRHRMYNRQVCAAEQAAARGDVFLLCPSRPLEVSRMEKDVGRLRAAYRLGRADTEARLAGLRDFLEGPQLAPGKTGEG